MLIRSASRCSNRLWTSCSHLRLVHGSSLEISSAELYVPDAQQESGRGHDGGQAIPTPTSGVKAGGESFVTMAGKHMTPVKIKSTGRKWVHGEKVVDGLLRDNEFKPLSDVVIWPRKRVPKLAHGLEAVLSRRGVHWLKDPETRTYNFEPYLENIPQVHEFAFNRLDGFVPSSQDQNLLAHARRTHCKYAGSTSSLTGILSQIYLLLSEEKAVNLSYLSNSFEEAPRFFTPGQRIPVSVILQYQDGIYMTDSDKERDDNVEGIILLPLGTMLEKFLTLPRHTFSKFMRTYTGNDHPRYHDVHRYAKHGKFLMRSQLDCLDPSLPGTGVFDLKTRAISPIRHDVHNYLAYVNRTLDSLTGRRGTFEEEYYDMIRSAFLEYSFQARIGNMDGVLVAYHNTARIFGFQYISLHEMDACLFGRKGAGDRVFLRCVYLMQLLYDQIAECFPAKSVRCTFEKRGPCVRVWVEPLEHDDPGGPAPIVELVLTLQNIMHGKATKGTYAVFADYPWSVQYTIQRLDRPGLQGRIRLRRDRAYARQMTIPTSPPDSTISLDEVDETEDAELLDTINTKYAEVINQ